MVAGSRFSVGWCVIGAMRVLDTLDVDIAFLLADGREVWQCVLEADRLFTMKR